MGWRNLATRDLAAALRISPRAAARRLSGDVDISLNELSAIAQWLSVEVSDLVDMHRPKRTPHRASNPGSKLLLA
ncbi:hypothetical protein [Pseudoclavibacter sp. JSM 162008]|uniref:hypothetical protein n=1 Tax=Pseudoclavibacter sp. JSM 162008 TaxID=3229855 RepID=UPI003525E53D